jgi:hypothetical protein
MDLACELLDSFPSKTRWSNMYRNGDRKTRKKESKVNTIWKTKTEREKEKELNAFRLGILLVILLRAVVDVVYIVCPPLRSACPLARFDISLVVGSHLGVSSVGRA